MDFCNLVVQNIMEVSQNLFTPAAMQRMIQLLFTVTVTAQELRHHKFQVKQLANLPLTSWCKSKVKYNNLQRQGSINKIAYFYSIKLEFGDLFNEKA